MWSDTRSSQVYNWAALHELYQSGDLMIGEYGDGEEDDEEEDLPMDLGNFEPLVQ